MARRLENRTQYILSDEALAIVTHYATERKRGEWLSGLIVEYHKLITGDMDVGECGIFEQINRRLERMDAKLNLLITEKVGKVVVE